MSKATIRFIAKNLKDQKLKWSQVENNRVYSKYVDEILDMLADDGYIIGDDDYAHKVDE
jgi:hypothetical protein